MISSKYSSLVGAAPKAVTHRRASTEAVPEDGFRSSLSEEAPGYQPMKFAESAAEVKPSVVSRMPWKGFFAGAAIALTLVGGAGSIACAQSMPSQSDVHATEQLEFLDHAGKLYQNKGGLLGGQKAATPEEALKQLKGGSSVYWNQAEGQAKQTIKNLQSLDSFVDSVKNQSLR